MYHLALVTCHELDQYISFTFSVLSSLFDEFVVVSTVSAVLHASCIVLYLHVYIYIALFEVHTNQKRFQYERPTEKRSLAIYCHHIPLLLEVTILFLSLSS